MTDLVQRARALAASCHKDQLDRAGLPVLGHVERVAKLVEGVGPEAQAIALLHDSIEDTAITAEGLRAAGMPEIVVTGVLALTRHAFGNETYMSFVQRAAAHPLARFVKLADLTDNMTRELPTDPEDRKQYESLRVKRYTKAVGLVLGVIARERQLL